MSARMLDTERLLILAKDYYRAYGYPIKASEAAEWLRINVAIIRTRVYTDPGLRWARSSKGCILVAK